MIIDAHLHLDEKVDGTPAGAARELNRQLEEASIDGAIVLHLEAQKWSLAEFSEAIRPYRRLRAFANVHPFHPDCREQLRHAVTKLNFFGLKLHPRLQEFDLSDTRVSSLVRFAGELGVPVLIDAFPDGTHLISGFSVLKYSDLARACDQTRIICAHMGGHHVLDFMMVAKRLPNLFFDMSYSLLYYQTSPIPQTMVYAMRSMKFDRIFYGSDYPDRTVGATLSRSLEFLKSQGLTEMELEKVMGRNFSEFLNWTPV